MFLTYCNAGKRDYSGQEYVSPYSRKAWEFQLVLNGSCTRVHREFNMTRETAVNAPTFCISGPDSIHGWRSRAKHKCTVLVFHFDDVDYTLKRLVARDGFLCVRFPSRTISSLRALYNRCMATKRQADDFSPMIYNIIASELTLFFLEFVPRAERSQGINYGANKVTEALAWYQTHLTSGPKIQQVANAVHLSPTHLRRLFHKVQGMPPQDALTRVQFDRAKELLLDMTASLEAVAASSGFSSASTFSRAFKTEFGLSPKAYRAAIAGCRQLAPEGLTVQ